MKNPLLIIFVRESGMLFIISLYLLLKKETKESKSWTKDSKISFIIGLCSWITLSLAIYFFDIPTGKNNFFGFSIIIGAMFILILSKIPIAEWIATITIIAFFLCFSWFYNGFSSFDYRTVYIKSINVKTKVAIQKFPKNKLIYGNQ